MSCDPHWTTYVSAFLTPTIAFFGIFIAIQQWRTARSVAEKKLKFDLFDRRFVVYDVARNFLGSIAQSGKAKDAEISKFISGTRESKWLLNSDIDQYFLKQIYHKALHLQVLDAMLEGIPVGAERSANVATQLEIKNWIIDQYDVLDEKFASFLHLEH